MEQNQKQTLQAGRSRDTCELVLSDPFFLLIRNNSKVIHLIDTLLLYLLFSCKYMSETRLALDPHKHACFWPNSGNASIYAPRAELQGNFLS